VTVRLPRDCRERAKAPNPIRIETIVRHANASFVTGDRNQAVKKIA